jgi:hypothetical protein
MSDLIARLRDWSDGPDTSYLCDEAADALEQQAAEIEALRADAERWRIGHDRYETVRLLSVPQFQDAYILNRRTGKPFDEIIDDLRPFKQYDINKRAGKAVTP